MFDLGTIVVLVVTFVICYCVLRGFLETKRNSLPSVAWALPVVGHLPFFGKLPTKTFLRWQGEYGNVYRIKMGSWDTVVINGYSAVKEAMDKGDDFSGRPDFVHTRLLTTICGGDEAISTGQFNPAYLQHRKLTTSALRVFTKTNVNSTQDLILEEVEFMIHEMSLWNGRPELIEESIKLTVGSIMYQLLYGKQRNVRDDEAFKTLVDFIKEVNTIAQHGGAVNFMPWLTYLHVWKGNLKAFADCVTKLENLRKHHVQEHMKYFVKGDINDLTNVYLNADLPDDVGDKTSAISRARLLVSLNEFLTAGFDTTQTLLRWLILYMIAYPDVQSCVQKEIDDTVGCNRKVGLIDKPKLNYTMATISETMRITSMTPFALPHLVTEETELTGLRIPKDMLAIVNLHSVHMEKSFWKDPEVFRPSRFLDSNDQIDKEISKHLIPFGLGRRSCTGEHLAKNNIFLLFSNLMQRCQFSSADKHLDTEPLPGLQYAPKPFRVVVQERN